MVKPEVIRRRLGKLEDYLRILEKLSRIPATVFG